MTISNTLTEKSFAPDAGSNQTFDLGFEVFETSDIVMFFDGLQVTSGFTVLPSTNQVTVDSDPGFNSSKTLTFRRVLDRTQGTNLANNQVLDVDAVEAALDKVTALHHQGMSIDNDGNLDASKLVDTTVTSRRITNVSDGILVSDAATVGQLANLQGGTTFVNSIAGDGGTLKTGAVTLTTDDVDEDGSPTNLYHTTARASAAAPIQSIASSDGSVTVTNSSGNINLAVQNTSSGSVPSATGSNAFIVSESSAYELQSGATARTSLGVGTGDDVSFNRVTAGENLVVAGTSTLSGAVTANGGVTSSGTITAEQLTSTDDLTVVDDAVIGGGITLGEDLTITGTLKGPSSNANRVGVNTSSASADGMLHVVEATAGSVAAPTTGNLLVLETNDSSNGLSILQPDPSGSDNTANIFFGKVADNDSGGITYTHNQTNRNQDSLALNFGGSTATFDANGGSPQLVLPSTTIIDNVATPTASDHAATKGYVDSNSGAPQVLCVQYSDQQHSSASGSSNARYHSLSPSATSSGSFSNVSGASVTSGGAGFFTLPSGTYLIECNIFAAVTSANLSRGPMVHLTTSRNNNSTSISGQVTGAGGDTVKSFECMLNGTPVRNLAHTQSLFYKTVLTVGSNTNLYTTVGLRPQGNTQASVQFGGVLSATKIA
tara:strand:+ start:17041 stop:19023 length:1983 start_codon:yes stop_codon:yes gene_type:complete